MPSIEQLTRYYASISDEELTQALSGNPDDFTRDTRAIIHEEATRRRLIGTHAASPASDASDGLADTERTLFTAIADYGATCDERMVQPLMAQYQAAAEELSEEQRLNMLLALIELVEGQHITSTALNPFLFVDTADRVV